MKVTFVTESRTIYTISDIEYDASYQLHDGYMNRQGSQGIYSLTWDAFRENIEEIGPVSWMRHPEVGQPFRFMHTQNKLALTSPVTEVTWEE